MSSSENEDELQTSDSVSIHESFLPEWQGDEVACELCGDAGGAASLMICENLDKGCIGARHIYCFHPVRQEVPEDEPWHCQFCTDHGFDQRPYAPAGIGLEDAAADSPAVSPARNSETPEADSGFMPGVSSPTVPSGGSPGGSRDSAAATRDALRRAATAEAAAEEAAEAAVEDDSSAEDSAAATGAAPPAAKQRAGAEKHAGKQLARTSSDGVSADAGTKEQQSAQPSQSDSMQPSQSDSKQHASEQQRPAKILPAKRKAEAAAVAPKLHDGWAKLARVEAGPSKPPAAPSNAGPRLPRLPPLRTGGSSRERGDATDRVQDRIHSANAAERPQLPVQQQPQSARLRDGEQGATPRLQADNSLFRSSSPRAAAAGSTAAAQLGRSGMAPPGARPAQPGVSGGAPQQQQHKRPLARPVIGSSAPGGPARPQQPPGAAQQQQRRQQQPNAGRPPGQVRGDSGAPMGTGADPTLEQPRRPPPSTVNVFASIMSDMQSKAKEFNAHEEEMRQQTEKRKEHEREELDVERKQVAASRGVALWSGAMRVREVPLEAADAYASAGRGQKPGDEGALSAPLHLVAFSLSNGADSAGAAAALPTQFEARTVSIDDIDFKYVDAHKGAALLIGANTADAGGVARAGSLCRSLLQRGAALRAELPASKAWLALVPNPPDGSPSLLWGLFVTAGDAPQPQHRHIRPPRSALKQAGQRNTRGLRWVDGRRSELRAEAVERGPGPAYSDAAAAAGAANGQPGELQPALQQQQQEAEPPSPTTSRQQFAWRHPGADGQQDAQQAGEPPQPDGQQHRHQPQPDQQPGQPPPPPGRTAPGQQQPELRAQPRPDGQAQLVNGDGAPGGAMAVLPPAASAATLGNGGSAAAPKLPLRGFRFSIVGYALGQDKTTEAHRALAGARALGAEHYRFPVTPGSVTALLLHPQMCQGGLEYNQWELTIKDFVLKPPIAFYRGLEYITLAARLGRRPAPAEVAPFELLACGISVISDAATLAADPDTLKKLYNALKRGMMGCKRRRGCTWAVRLSPLEHMRLEDAYRRSHQKEVGQALQMFNSRLPGEGSGPALSARLTEEEVSSKTVPDPPQLVRDAVKVAYKHMTDCRHVILASGDRELVSKANSQATVLACEGLGGALDLVTRIVDHLEATCHRPGESH